MKPSTPALVERLAMYANTYKASDESEAVEAYKTWAPWYEHHIIDMGWEAPSLCSGLLLKHMGTFGKILDVGAGTGLVGRSLKDAAAELVVDALDLSPDMLSLAAEKEVYRHIITGSATSMDIDSNTYDAVICVGALNFGHIPAYALRECVRVVKSGGFVTFTTRVDFYEAESRSVQESMVDDSIWTLIEMIDYSIEAVKDIPHKHWCFRVQ